jgi:hypothetical protein
VRQLKRRPQALFLEMEYFPQPLISRQFGLGNVAVISEHRIMTVLRYEFLSIPQSASATATPVTIW